MNEPHWDHLIHGHLDDALTDSAQAEFESLMIESASARRRFWELAEVHGLAREAARLAWAEDAADEAPTGFRSEGPKPRRWLQWRPLAAAAAGIVFGMLCTSVVFGYVMPKVGKAITLLQESFETGPAPMVTGRPDKAGVWSGDYSEVGGGQQGVKPESGKKMLRFLRADFEGRTIPESFSSDVFRLVDMRPYRREFADGGAVVQLSAVFNAAPFGDGESYKCGLTIFALDAALVDGSSLNAEQVLATQSLARSTSSHLHMDRDSATWQRLGNELRVPPNTDYLLIQIGVSNVAPPNGMRRDSFAGHFADEVKLVLAHRPEIAVP